MQYYMHINGQQVGPFDESLLMLNGLTPTTPVWADGMTGWMPANQVAALSYLFVGQVPPSYGAPQVVSLNMVSNHISPAVQCHPQIWCGAFWSPSSAVCHSAS